MGFWAAAIPIGLYLLDKMSKGQVSGSSAYADASKQMGAGMNKAVDQISTATNKAMDFNKPYMNPEVFQHLQKLVTSGAFQQPYGKSFQAQSFQSPGFAFNPSNGGNFNYAPWNPSGPAPSFTPSGLPPGMAMPQGMPQAPPQKSAPNPSQMVRPPMQMPQMSDLIAAGAGHVANFPQNMPSVLQRPGQQNPLMQSSGPVPPHVTQYNSTGRNPVPMSMADMWRMYGTNRWGSGTFMPGTGLPR